MGIEPFRVYVGHALDLLAQMEPESVQCVVTSPPYPGQRSYEGAQAVIWGGDTNCPHNESEPIDSSHISHSQGRFPGKKRWVEAYAETGGHTEQLTEHYTGKTRWQHVAQEQGIPVRDVVPGAWEKISVRIHHPRDRRCELCKKFGPTRSESGKTITWCPNCLKETVREYVDDSPLLGFEGPKKSIMEQKAIKPLPDSALCTLCGCWRGSYGLEPLIDCLAWARGEPPCSVCYVCHTRATMAAIWRVLRKDGTVWLNLGDVYIGSTGKSRRTARPYKAKDMGLVPESVALALRADGWWVRSRIVWEKPNPMPESATDRPTSSTEFIWMLAKSQRYAFYMDAVAEKANPLTQRSKPVRATDGVGGDPGNDRRGNFEKKRHIVETRHLRDVWRFPTQPSPEAHFAAFPEELPTRCILASTKEGDLVLDPFCGTGTTLAVAEKLGRRWIGFDLAYQAIAERKTAQRSLTNWVT